LIAFVYPITIGLIRKLLTYVQYHTIDKIKRTNIYKTRKKMSKLVTYSLRGLADVQLNNLQRHHLQLLDTLIDQELQTTAGYKHLIGRTWNSFSHRNILEFVAEVYVVHMVMNRQNIDYKQYGKIQHDITRVLQLGRKIYGLLRMTEHVIEYQRDVVELINIPNFFA